MDYEFIFSLVFSLLVIMIVGASILLFPITRRLGTLLERRLDIDRLPADELQALTSAVHSLTNQVESLQQRQEFTEGLLSSGSGLRPEVIASRTDASGSTGSD